VDQRTEQFRAALKRVELTYDATLAVVGAALDLWDYERAGHSQRVTLYCLELARTMGYSEEQLTDFARGAYLHDIGMIGIPDAILLKKGRLSREETALMREHVRIGYELVSRIAFLAGAAELVLTHHERYDGTGYPQGLLGAEIPLGARIFAVADTLEAITSTRPYRWAMPCYEARAQIEWESGRLFDPHVVNIFRGTPDVVWENIRLEVAKAGVGLQNVSSSSPRRSLMRIPSPMFGARRVN
jgi:cyclic di-GMP phosphodiesterase